MFNAQEIMEQVMMAKLGEANRRLDLAVLEGDRLAICNAEAKVMQWEFNLISVGA